MKKNFKIIVIIILVIAVGLGLYFVIDKVTKRYKGINQNENVLANTSNSEEIENKDDDADDSLDDESEYGETKSNVKKIDISDEELVNILIDVEPFEGADKLSTEKKLAIVYNALDKNKISAYKNRGDGQGKIEYTEAEVNGIVYSLFGSELEDNKNYGEVFTYNAGKYTLVHSDSGKEKIEAKNIEYDVAAGTRYINYDLYVNKILKGSYAIGKSNETKYVTCKKEMK